MVPLKRKGNTQVYCGDNETKIIYHNTPIVIFNKMGITLNTGSFFSSTTKSRMNQASHEFNLGFVVFQQNFSWKIKTSKGIIPFDQSIVHLKRE